MSELNFSMRLRSTYAGEKNTVAGLEVEHMVDGEWQPLELDVTAPGFDIFIYAVFTCQHMFFRINCAERGLLLDSAEGSIFIGADADRNMQTMRVHFSGRLGSGLMSPGDIDYIVSRMEQCPVSRNIRVPADTETTVNLD